jgi:hypothetical protein
VASFAETQLIVDPNDLPQRAVAKFTRQPEESNYLELLENRDKRLIQQNKQETIIKQKQKFDERSKVIA